MADFTINNQYGQVFQQGETINNLGSGVAEHVGLLVSRLDALLSTGEVDEESALPVRSALLEAAAAREPAAQATALGRARALVAATAVLAALAEPLDRVLSLVTGG